MVVTTFNDWKLWAQSYSMLPFVQQFPLHQADQVLSWEKAWEAASDCSFVLESGKMGKYSFLGLHPVSTLSGKGQKAVATNIHETNSTHLYGTPLSLVKEWMRPYHSPKVDNAPKFIGGCVGYWGYDVVRSIEKIPVIAADDLPFPDYYFMMMRKSVV